MFNTMSPLPKFREWVMSLESKDASLLTAGEEKLLGEDRILKLQTFLQDPNRGHVHPTLVRAVLRLAKEYLISTKITHSKGTACFDPVGQFHFSNGAELFDLIWDADDSTIRSQQSFGIMAQYRYPQHKAELEKNQEKFQFGEIALNNQMLAFF